MWPICAEAATMEIPNSKPQTPGKFQNPNIQRKECDAFLLLEFEAWDFLGAWCLGFGATAAALPSEKICHSGGGGYLSRLMPKSISRSKTRKAVAKRFKITARGKVLRSQASRRHLLSAKNAKRRRHLGKWRVCTRLTKRG
jgi:large subunit ribosomal protein L35